MTHKPGPGWQHVNGPVWDHVSGVRVHVMGACVLANGQFIYGNTWPESIRLDKCIRMNGGNRKRGIMVWAHRLNVN